MKRILSVLALASPLMMASASAEQIVQTRFVSDSFSRSVSSFHERPMVTIGFQSFSAMLTTLGLPATTTLTGVAWDVVGSVDFSFNVVNPTATEQGAVGEMGFYIFAAPGVFAGGDSTPIALARLSDVGSGNSDPGFPDILTT